MKSYYFFIALISIILIANKHVLSQEPKQSSDTDSNKTYVITKSNGTEYIGKIINDDGREVLIETQNLGKVYVKKSELSSIRLLEDKPIIVDGKVFEAGPFSTRYCFTTNAHSIRKGENYALVNLYGPEVHFALSDRFSLGIMSSWIGTPFVLAGKYSFQSNNKNVNFSVGSLLGTSGYLFNFKGYGGLHWVNMTVGERTRNFTLGAGYLYLTTGNEKEYTPIGTYYSYSEYYPHGAVSTEYRTVPITKGPIISLAGIIKIGSRASFVFDSMVGFMKSIENTLTVTEIVKPTSSILQDGIYQHVVTDDKVNVTWLFLMPGMRFQSTDRKAVQVSLAGVAVFRPNDSISFPLPMVTWFYKI